MYRSRTLIATLFLAAALVVGAASPAAAHDELVASSPSPGERLDAAPSEVSLTFSADVLTIGAAVVIADASGRDWAAGAPVVTDGVVTVAIEPGMTDAGYEIRWRVVSEDGHPISGLVPFTVGTGSPLERSPAATAAPTDIPAAGAGDAVQEQSAHEDQAVLRIALVGIGGAIVAAAVFTLIQLLRRKKGTPAP